MIEPGQQLLHYRLIEKIGEGGMGVVWKALDTSLEREVAIKVLPEDFAADPDRLARFKREARAVAALNHPNIVTVHSVDQCSSPTPVHFITMELVEGHTLTTAIPRNGFELRPFLEIAIPLADAVSCAHREGITHRDLKPDNIMIDVEGRLRILDFGLARRHLSSTDPADETVTRFDSVTEEGKILGTVAYMSPEQAEGKSVDARTDIFSLGTMLYEMALGVRPFQGNTSISTISAILKDEPDSVLDSKPSFPKHFGRIIRRCLAKQPDRRYQTALDLRNELEELRSDIDSGMTPGTKIDRSARKSSRSIFIAATVMVLVVAVIGVWLMKKPGPAAKQYTPQPITSTLGWVSGHNWSPNSEFIAFEQVRNGSIDILVQPVAGGQAEVRVGGPGDQTNARWSPDGKYLAYLSSHESGSFVYLVPPHGGTPRKLIATNVPTLNNEIVMGDYPWSPDGGTLLISLVTHPGRLTIHRVDRENGAAVPLTFPPIGTEDTSASFSRDGERIVFERRKSGNGMLMVMPSAGGDPETLLEDEFDNTKPAWRPDNRRIVFRSDRGGGNPDLWEFDTSTGKITLLLADTNDLQHYSISADDRLAYSPFRHDTFLFVVDTDTGEKQQLTSHRRGNYGARFSPDDQTLAYQSTRTGDSEIWLHYLDGSPETRITEDPGLDLYPDWSPDGEHLIFLSNRGQDGYKIYIANRDGGGKRLLIDRTVYVDNAGTVNIGLISRWSPDGERIAFLVPGEQSNVLWTIRTDGTDAREILKDISSFDWYRDNRHAIYTRTHGGENEMIAVNLDTGQEQTLFTGPFTEIDVAPDGSAVTFSFGRGHHGMGVAVLKLELPSVPGGLPRTVGEPEFVVPAEDTWHVHNPSWSSDSRSIVYTQDQDYGDIYELVERQSSRDD